MKSKPFFNIVKTLLLFTATIYISDLTAGNVTFITPGSTWKYLDNGSNQGSAWRGVSFNDATWKTGNAQFGYGDGDETTIVQYGNIKKKYVTTYFRKSFTVANATLINSLKLSVLRDDGAVIYLNGTEVFRTNMPPGSISHTTLANFDVSGADESAFIDYSINPALLVSGNNVIAVEIHQYTRTSVDLSFDFQLTGTDLPSCDPPTTLSANNISAISADLNWNAVAGAVSYNIRYRPNGNSSWTNLSSVSNAVSLSGLTASTNYEYQVQTVCSAITGSYSASSNFTTLAVYTDILIPAGSSWKYLDNGTNQGTAWRNLSFNDASWATGNAELGYGDGDEATVVSYGPNSLSKYVTTYFRKIISVNNPAAYSSVNLSVLRDDGAVVYINGTEVFRTNMPTGTIAYNTYAVTAIGTPEEYTYYSVILSPSVFATGNNVIAVEIHQANGTSSDLSFNLKLEATSGTSTTTTLIRGPYLQLGTSTSEVIRWRTDIASDSKVKYGLSPGNLTSTVYNPASVIDHELQITGLSPSTKYYYSIESGGTLLQGNSENFFITAPTIGTVKPTRIWVIGDAGTNYAEQNQVRDAYYNFTGNTYTDVWLWLGDNAYQSGTDGEYQTNVFVNHYERMFKQTVAWPAAGNHDIISANATNGTGPYYDIFTLPKNAEAGGLASGTEAYYSFNYSNIHFICLESTTSSFRASNGAMATWLANDLAANTQKWTIVYFHHPPYTKGSHNSDIEIELVEMRQNIVPILENYKVDLVLSGHSHCYERSFLINGHYGLESSFNSSMQVNSGSGTMPNPYIKSNLGSVYAVAGCSGKLSGTTSGWPHNAMYTSTNTVYGSMVIDIHGDTLHSKFINNSLNPSVIDQFTILKTGALPRYLSSEEMNVQPDFLLFPNPFEDELHIQYTLTNAENVSLEIYNSLGQKVTTLTDTEYQERGNYFYTFSSEQSGVYFVKLKLAGKTPIIKSAIMK
jgi:hypothetical protein